MEREAKHEVKDGGWNRRETFEIHDSGINKYTVVYHENDKIPIFVKGCNFLGSSPVRPSIGFDAQPCSNSP